MTRAIYLVIAALFIVIALIALYSYSQTPVLPQTKNYSGAEGFSVVSGAEVTFREEAKPTLPVSSPESITGMQSGKLLGNRFDYTSLSIRENSTIVSPFDGHVYLIEYLGASELFGQNSYYIIIRNVENESFHIIFPASSTLFVSAGEQVSRGGRIAQYYGGTLGGKAKGIPVIINFDDKLGKTRDLTKDTEWASGKPAVYAP